MRTGTTFTEQLGSGLGDILNPLRPIIGDVLKPYQQIGASAAAAGQAVKMGVYALWAGVAVIAIYLVTKQ